MRASSPCQPPLRSRTRLCFLGGPTARAEPPTSRWRHLPPPQTPSGVTGTSRASSVRSPRGPMPVLLSVGCRVLPVCEGAGGPALGGDRGRMGVVSSLLSGVRASELQDCPQRFHRLMSPHALQPVAAVGSLQKNHVTGLSSLSHVFPVTKTLPGEVNLDRGWHCPRPHCVTAAPSSACESRPPSLSGLMCVQRTHVFPAEPSFIRKANVSQVGVDQGRNSNNLKTLTRLCVLGQALGWSNMRGFQ